MGAKLYATSGANDVINQCFENTLFFSGFNVSISANLWKMSRDQRFEMKFCVLLGNKSKGDH